MSDFIFQIQDDIITVAGGDNPPFLIKHVSQREFNQIRRFFEVLYKRDIDLKSKHLLEITDNFLMSDTPLSISEIYERLSIVFKLYDQYVDDIRALITYQFSNDKKIESKWCHSDRSQCKLKEKYGCKWAKSAPTGLNMVIRIGASKKIINGCKIEWAQERWGAMENLWGESRSDGGLPFLLPPGVIFMKHKQRSTGGDSE